MFMNVVKCCTCRYIENKRFWRVDEHYICQSRPFFIKPFFINMKHLELIL